MQTDPDPSPSRSSAESAVGLTFVAVVLVSLFVAGSLGVVATREAAPAAEIQEVLNHPWILALSRGLRIQSTNVRFSRMMSALRSMSGCSGTRLPYASMSGRSSATVAR